MITRRVETEQGSATRNRELLHTELRKRGRTWGMINRDSRRASRREIEDTSRPDRLTLWLKNRGLRWAAPNDGYIVRIPPA